MRFGFQCAWFAGSAQASSQNQRLPRAGVVLICACERDVELAAKGDDPVPGLDVSDGVASQATFKSVTGLWAVGELLCGGVQLPKGVDGLAKGVDGFESAPWNVMPRSGLLWFRLPWKPTPVHRLASCNSLERFSARSTPVIPFPRGIVSATSSPR